MPSIILPQRYQKPVLGAQIDWSHPLSRGLVGCWLFNEGIGGTVNDLASRNNGAWQGTLGSQWAAGQRGGSGKFNGTDNYILLSNTASLKIATGTLSVWFKTSNAGTSYRALIGKNSAYNIFLVANVLMLYDEGGAVNRSTGISVNDNKWHHAVVTFRSGVSNGTVVYLDSIAKLTTTMSISNQNSAPCIGLDSTGQNFAGMIDAPMIYNRALSDSDIARLYQEPYCMIAAPAMYRYFSPLTIPYTDSSLTMAGSFSLGSQLSTPVIQWASNSKEVRFQFTGTQIEVQVANAFSAGSVMVSIDGGAETSVTIPTGSVQWVVLATGLADTTHTCVLAQWSTSRGIVQSPMFRATGAAPAFARTPGFEGNVTVFGPPSALYIKPDSGVSSLTSNQGFPTLYLFKWTGSSITFRARCAGLKVYMLAAQSTYVLTVDGVDRAPVAIPSSSPDGYTWVSIATGLDDTAYHVYTFRQIYANSSTLFAYQILPNSTTGGDFDTAYRPASPTQRVLGFGDSITWACTATSDSRIGFVYQLASALGQEGMNRGISGTTAHNFVTGASQYTTSSGEARVGADVSSVTPQPTAVIDLYGTNDLNSVLPSQGGGGALTAAQFQTSLYNIYSNILTALPNCTILALGILDRSETMLAYNSTSAASRTSFNNAKAAAVAQIQAAFPGSHITYIDTTGWITMTPGAFGTASVDSNDGLHPNAAGYTKITNKLLVYMRTRFRRIDSDIGVYGIGGRV